MVILMRFQIFEVTSTTRVRDLVQDIFKKLSLTSGEGYSIFVKTYNKVCLNLNHVSSIFFQRALFPYSSTFLLCGCCSSQVLSLNEADYFFDSLRQITDWSEKMTRMKDGKHLRKSRCIDLI